MTQNVKRNDEQSLLKKAGRQPGDELPVGLKELNGIVQMTLKLNQIKLYDQNPRREINPEYDTIKDSVRKQGGLNNNFNVTRRPGDELYMIYSGGNTRFSVLCELYEETRDPRFSTVTCLFVPWVSESDVLSRHLVENLVRGEMNLIDKAYAYNSLKQQIEQEQATTLSSREFVLRAESMGLKLSRRQASRLDFTIELDDAIPNALRAGLGARTVDELKRLKSACSNVPGVSPAQINALFANTLSTQDDEHFNIDLVKPALCNALAISSKTTPQVIGIMLEPSDAINTADPSMAMIQPDVNRVTKGHKKQAPDFQALCFVIAKKIAESVGLIDLIVSSNTVPGFSIQTAHVAPPVESPLYHYLQAMANQQGIGLFADVDLLSADSMDDQTLSDCFSLLMQCRKQRET
jgi:ParB family protein of integrating conjugative element (PFGI_1 class)